jgi:hypothetical protein
VSLRLPSYSEFARLRLRQFLPPETEICDLNGFEWNNGLWIHEGIGFTWFGRLESAPLETAGLELNFCELTPLALSRMLGVLGLRLGAGMSSSDVMAAAGPPLKTLNFVSDRVTTMHEVGAADRFILGCTVHNVDGLIHVSLIRADVVAMLQLT